MAESTINDLLIRIDADSASAADQVKALATALESMKSSIPTSGKTKALSDLAAGISALGASANASGVENASRAISSISEALQTLGSLRLTSVTRTLGKIPEVINGLSSTDMSGVRDKIQSVSDALAPLTNMPKTSSFNSTIRGLGRLADVTAKLDDKTIANFAAQVQKVTDAVTPLSAKMMPISTAIRGIGTASSTASPSVDQFGTHLRSLGEIAVAAKIKIAQFVTQIARKAVQALKEAVDDAVEWDGTMNRFVRTFGDYGKPAYDFMQKANQEMGLNLQQWMQYTSIYSSMMEGFGVDTENASKMALGYSELTYDIWAAYNDIYKSYDDAATAVQSAISGQVRAIRRAGIDITQASLEQTAANHGLAISLSDATQAQKEYLIYQTMVDQAASQGVIGQYAHEMNTAEGAIRAVKQELRSLAQAIGSLFLPLLQTVIPVITAIVNLIGDAVRQIAKFFGIEMQQIDWSYAGTAAIGNEASDVAGDLAGGMGDVGDATKGATAAAEEYKNTILGIDEINPLNDVSGGGGGGSGSGGSGGSGARGSGAGHSPVFDVNPVWDDSIFEKIKKRFGGFGDWIKERLASWKQIIDDSKLAESMQSLGTAISKAWDNIDWSGFEWFFNWLTDSALMIGSDTLSDTLQTCAGIISGDLYEAVDGLKNLCVDLSFDPVISLADAIDKIYGTDFAGWLRDVKKELKDFDFSKLPGYQELKNAWNRLQWAWIKVKAAFNTVQAKIGEALQKLESSQALQDLWSASKWFYGVAFDVFLESIASAMNVIADALNVVADIITGDNFDDALDDIKTLNLDLIAGPLKIIARLIDDICGTDLSGWIDKVKNKLNSIDLSSLSRSIKRKFSDTWDDVGKDAVDFAKGFYDNMSPDMQESIDKLINKVGDLFGTEDARKKTGEVLGKAILDGIKKPFEDIEKWVKENIIDPISNALSGQTISGPSMSKTITPATAGTDNPTELSGITVPVSLQKFNWTTVEDWIGNIPVLGQGIQLVKSLWTTVSDWVGKIDDMFQGIKLKKVDWSDVGGWVSRFMGSIVQKDIGLKKKWQTVGDWVKKFIGAAVEVSVELAKHWRTVASWVEQFKGGAVNVLVGLTKHWGTVAQWVRDRTGGVVDITVNLIKGWKGTLKRWLGLQGGGIIANNGALKFMAEGGVIIPSYATGTNDAHGSMFLAGENGPEMVGHIGGRTEVMNRFQLASVMKESIETVMEGYMPSMNAMNGNIIRGANGVIRAITEQPKRYSADEEAAYGYISDSNNEGNSLLREQNSLLRQLIEKADNSGTQVSTSMIQTALSRQNRRVGVVQ